MKLPECTFPSERSVVGLEINETLWPVTLSTACRASVIPALTHHVRVECGGTHWAEPLCEGFELALPGHGEPLTILQPPLDTVYTTDTSWLRPHNCPHQFLSLLDPLRIDSQESGRHRKPLPTFSSNSTTSWQVLGRPGSHQLPLSHCGRQGSTGHASAQSSRAPHR